MGRSAWRLNERTRMGPAGWGRAMVGRWVMVAAVWAGWAAGVGAAAGQVSVLDVAYGDGHVRQVLDVHRPAGQGAERRPCVLWVHGGGWQSGDKATAGPGRNLLLGAGFVVASTNYRYSSQGTSPAQVHDVKAAVRHLRANAAAYGIDPTRIGIWGSSAGGHLAALVGTSGGVAAAEGTVGPWEGVVSSRVQAVVDWFGPADFFRVEGWHLGAGTAEAALLGFALRDVQANRSNPAWAEQVALALLTGPTTHVSADDPPFLIAHGDADGVVWPRHSELLHADLVAAGGAATLRIVPGAGHGLGPVQAAEALAFFQETIGVGVPIGCPRDVDADGRINVDDLHALHAAGADLDHDGAADAADRRCLEAALRRAEGEGMGAGR